MRPPLVVLPGGLGASANATPPAPKHRAYGMDPAFEREVAWCLATVPLFWSRLKGMLDPRAMSDPAARLAVEAVRDIVAADPGAEYAPIGIGVVTQGLAARAQDGKLKRAEVKAVYDMLSEVEDRETKPTPGSVLRALKPVLVRAVEDVAIDAAIKAGAEANRGDVLAPFDAVRDARQIGETSSDERTYRRTAEDAAALAASRAVERLSLGLPELDRVLDGGLGCSSLTTFLAGTNAGKSFQLVNVANAASLAGYHVALGVTEMPIPAVRDRLDANLVGLPVAVVKSDRAAADVDRLVEARLPPGAGDVLMRAFSAGVSTPEDVIAWVDREEQALGAPIRVVVVDVAEDLFGGVVERGGGENSYQSQGNVYMRLYNWARDTRRWVVTACQAQRKAKRSHGSGARSHLDVDDAADSFRKMRKADYVLSINVEDDASPMVTYFLAKARDVQARVAVGPFPMDLGCARIVAAVPWGLRSP